MNRRTPGLGPALSFSFPALIRIQAPGLHDGCVLDLRVYGRGTPRRLGDSSYHRYLKRQGAWTILRVSPRFHLVARVCGRAGLRARIKMEVRRILHDRGRLRNDNLHAALGVLLGNAKGLAYDFKSKSARLGILHLFAASGLHLAIFYGCLYLPLALLLGRKHPCAVFAPLPPCLAYLWLLDFPVSLTRAFVFVCFFALKSVVHRRLATAEQITNAAVVIMLLMPRDFCTLSGALSFGAVCGILYFHRPLLDLVLRPARFITRLLLAQATISIAAGLFTIPMLLYTFGGYSYLSPIANFMLVPLMSLVLPLLYAGLLLSTLPVPALLAEPFWFLIRAGIGLFTGATSVFAEYDLYYRYSDWFCLPVGAIALLLILLIARMRLERARAKGAASRRPGLSRACALACIALLGPGGALLTDAWRLAVKLF